MEEHARRADMCALRQIASNHTHFARPTAMRCLQHLMSDKQSNMFHSMALKDLVVLELRCGTAGVTASFRKAGMLAVCEWIIHDSIVGVFWAPPCGTASAARQIDLPDETAVQILREFRWPTNLTVFAPKPLTSATRWAN